MKTAVIGYGLSAKVFHLPFIRQQRELELVALVTSQPQAQLDWPALVIYPTAAQALARSDIELVVITTPNHTHFELAKAALLAGKHVLVEKPFTLTLAETDMLLQLARQQQKLITVFHNRRFDGDFLTVQQLLQSGQLGRLHYMESRFDRFRPQVQQRWKEQAEYGGGIFYDLVPHLLDQVLLLFGLPQQVSCQQRLLRTGSQAADYVQLQLHYAELEVVLASSPVNGFDTQRFMLQGDKGCYRKFGLDPQEPQLKAGLMPGQPGYGMASEEQDGELWLAQAPDPQRVPTLPGQYQHFYQQFCQALQGNAELPVPALQIRQLMLVLAAAQQSAAGNCNVAVAD
jgi:predicted dehydrogenase